MQWISVDENALWMEAPLLGQSPFLDSLETKFVILRWVKSPQSEMEIWNCALIISQQHSHHNTAWQAPLHFTSLTDDATFSCRRTSGTVSKKTNTLLQTLALVNPWTLDPTRLRFLRHLRDKTTRGWGRLCWNRATDDEADSTAIFCSWDPDFLSPPFLSLSPVTMFP